MFLIYSRNSQTSEAVLFAYSTFPRAPALNRGIIGNYSRASLDPDRLDSAFAFLYSDVDLAFWIASPLGLLRVNVFVPMLVARQTDSGVELEVSSQ